MMKRLLTVFLLFTALFARGNDSPVALSDGETLKYRVRWGLFPGAGEIVVKARETEIAGMPHINITTHTSTRGFVRSLYVFDGEGECIFDARDGRLLAVKAWSSTSKKNTRTMAVLDHSKQQVQYVDYLRPDRSLELPLPEGNPMDLITSLIQTRTWDLKPGEKREVTVMFDDEFYDITIEAEGYERVRTGMGEYNALLLVPSMPENPKGLFKRGGRVRVWISQDELRLPVKFEVSMKVGTGVAVLSDYTPPTNATAVATVSGDADSRP